MAAPIVLQQSYKTQMISVHFIGWLYLLNNGTKQVNKLESWAWRIPNPVLSHTLPDRYE